MAQKEPPSINFVFNIARVPCARKCLLDASIASSIAFAFSFFRYRNPTKAVLWFTGTFASVSAVSWTLCRHKFLKSKEHIERVMGAYSREPTEQDLAETRETLRKIAESERERRSALALLNQNSNTDTTEIDKLLLDPKTVAAALSTTSAPAKSQSSAK